MEKKHTDIKKDDEDVCSSSDSQLSSQPIQDIAILDKNFDLSRVPLNYLRRRSNIEELVYRAGTSETQKKSPFASFKMANDCIDHLPEIDIITGINSLKSVLKMPFSNTDQVSLMVHRIGNTWLFDAFDVDTFFIELQRSNEWRWFRDFIVQRNFQLCQPDFSRRALIMRDLYGKFLYHCVESKYPQLLQLSQTASTSGVLPLHDTDSATTPSPPSYTDPFSSTATTAASSANAPQAKSPHRGGQVVEEEHLQYSEWRVNDLSFLVGSDLAIFGTKTHPCISLKLSHSRKPINVLTGIDMWLENIINEVPEVAMCFHTEGIVMQEYKIFRTEDLPAQCNFQESEVRNIARNLVVFLRRNATKDGHTYWLFREKESEVVKLYDLTTLVDFPGTEPQSDEGVREEAEDAASKNTNAADVNPFVLPVAILCYRMAERRVQQHRKMTPREVATETRDQYRDYLADVFRLLRNCINILASSRVVVGGQQTAELRARATLLLFQLYLEAKPSELAASLTAIHESTEHAAQEVTLNVAALRTTPQEDQSSGMGTETHLVATPNVLPGDFIMDTFKSKDTDRILRLALTAVDEAQQSGLAMVQHTGSTTAGSGHFQHYSLAPMGNIDREVQRVLLCLLVSLAEATLQDLCLDKRTAGLSEEETVKLDEAFKNAYIAYLLFQDSPEPDRERRVLETFTTIFLTHNNLCSSSATSPTLANTPEQTRALHILAHKNPNSSGILPAPGTHLTDHYPCALALVNALRRLLTLLGSTNSSAGSIKVDKALATKIRNRSLPLTLNHYVNVLVQYECAHPPYDDVSCSQWESCLKQTLDWLDESMSACARCLPKLAAVLSCGQAKLFRLAASLAALPGEEEKVEALLQKALVAYDRARDVLRRSGTGSAPDLWDNISHDRLVTGVEWYDRVFKRAWASTEPDTELITTGVNFLSDILKRETNNLSPRTLVPLTILRVRQVSGTWLLAWKKKRQFPHDSMVRDLRESYLVISDRADLTIEVVIILSYLVMIQASQKDVLSLKSLLGIFTDALKARAPLAQLTQQSTTEAAVPANEMITTHTDLLANHILAVAQRLAQKAKTSSRLANKPAVLEGCKQLYGRLLKAKTTSCADGSLYMLAIMLDHIAEFNSTVADLLE